MCKKDFKQRMSQDKALTKSKGAVGLSSKEAGSKLLNHYNGLKDSWTRVLETSSLYENAYTLYDSKARPIRSYAKNYLGGYTYVDSKLDFTGKPEYAVTKHKLLG